MLTDEQLKNMSKTELYTLRLRINNFITQYEQAALDAMNLGIAVPDYDLKPGRKSRSVISEAELVKDLTMEGVPYSDLYLSKLIGVPALDKLFAKSENGEELYSKHIKETLGKPTLIFTGSEGTTTNG